MMVYIPITKPQENRKSVQKFEHKFKNDLSLKGHEKAFWSTVASLPSTFYGSDKNSCLFDQQVPFNLSKLNIFRFRIQGKD